MASDINEKKKQTRRGRGFSKKCTNSSLKIIGNNCAGLNGKKDSFTNLIKKKIPQSGHIERNAILDQLGLLIDKWVVLVQNPNPDLFQ